MLVACGDDATQTDGSSEGASTDDDAASETGTDVDSTDAGDSTSDDGTTEAGDDSSAGDDGSDTSDTDGEPGDVVTCEGWPLQTPSEGTCEVVQTGTNGAVRLRGVVLAPDSVLRGGEVLVDAGGRIACVDCDCGDAPAAADATVVVCGDGVISPGLINPHDHISYAANAPIGEGEDRYEHRHDWRVGPDRLDVPGGAEEEQVLAAELRFVMSGATSAASAGGEYGLLRNLDIGGHLEGLPAALADSDTFPLGDQNGFQNSANCNYGNSRTAADDIRDLRGYLPHIAEGINAAARNEFVCQTMGEFDLIAPQTAVVHAIAVTPADAQLMAEDMTKVVWSPRSNIVLYGNTAPVTMLDRMGVAIALGTDWVATGSMNILRELRCAAELNSTYYDEYFSPRQLWQMVTTNAAFATGTFDAIGMLKPGYIADIAIFAAAGRVDHAAVVEAELEHVTLVMRGGEILYGDASLLEGLGLGTDCDAEDVCGTDKLFCLADDIGGRTVEDLRAAIEPVYPLYFCDVPDDEPTCVPSRESYDGAITDVDGDGDGLDDAADNCPAVFNPVREMEDEQGDADGDGLGDACDECPLERGNGCAMVSGDDFDDDAVDNGTDNCPLLPNGDQADADGDGHGDACDACASFNAGPSPCPIAVEAIRDPDHPDHPDEGTSVAVTDVYVTAVRNDGFYVQSDSLEPFTGIFAYTGGPPPELAIGNRVTVSGVYDEFYDLSEITNATVTIDDAGTELPFEPIAIEDPADIADGATAEGYESMLVGIGEVTIVDVNPDGDDDYDEFVVTGGLRIDDGITDGTVGSGLGNDCPEGTSFGSIVGVLGFGFGNFKLQPRDEDDVAVLECDPFAE